MSFRPCARRTLAAALAAASIFIGPAALSARQLPAPPSTDEAARLAEAERACLEGDYPRGIEILVALYLTSRHPAYLHNQARCYEQNGQYRQAAGRYREFLLKVGALPSSEEGGGLTPDKVAAIEARAARLEQLASDAAPARPEPLPAPDPAAGSDRALADAMEPPAAAGPAAGAGWRGTGIALIAIGGLGLVGSGAAGLYAQRAERDISAASIQGGRAFDPDQYRAGERAARIATIGFIAAPAAALVGLLLYWKSAPAAAEGPQARVRVLPTLAVDGLGALVAVRY
jgi:hypothetical protein